jgi:exopolysaccharide biosynthesis polyprenyl glycosylphosphotransferase
MRKLKRKMRTLVIVIAFVALSIVVGKTAFAAFGGPSGKFYTLYSDPSTDSEKLTLGYFSKPKAHAPEPSSLVLFGSGLLGMVLSFIRRAYIVAKRAFDIAISIFAVIVLSPLFLITALMIKCSSRGPVIFTQVRVGKEGQHFKIYKFRTMRVDAEKVSGPVWAKENDPRLLPIGKFLRKTHIDEIPQFFNVLKGDMSFIGPRPERPIFVEKFKKEIYDYEKRLQVKPGITGLAQVRHRYDETIADVRKKIKYDILYIKKLCLWTDLLICLRTVRVVLTGEGAR